jgi:menaquinol-cytochrome c reductase iron-sulfur subunit
MNSTAPEPQVQETTRRRFHEIVIAGTQAIIGAALAVPALAYLFGPTKPRKAANWIETVDVATLTPKTPVEVSFRVTRVDGWKVINEKQTAWVVKMDDSKVVAFGPQCTHLGCAYHWEEGKSQFICPCHTTLFSLDGAVVTGPAPRPLDRYDTKVDGTKLLIGQLRNSETKA